MELKKEFIEDCLEKAVEIFKEANLCVVDNDIKIEYIDGDKFIDDARKPLINRTLIEYGIYKNFEKEYPGFLVVFPYNKDRTRRIFGLPYYITIDFNRAKRLLMPFSKTKVEKYFISVFLHEITHIFEDVIIEKNEDFYNELLEMNGNITEAANENLAEVVSYKYGYSDVADKITDELHKDIYARMRKLGINPKMGDNKFKAMAEKFNPQS